MNCTKFVLGLFLATTISNVLTAQQPTPAKRPSGGSVISALRAGFAKQSSEVGQSVIESAGVLAADEAAADGEALGLEPAEQSIDERFAQIWQGSLSGPGFTPRMIKTPQERVQLRNVPIIHRPYRPGHFYGNSVRLIHQSRQNVPNLLPRVLPFRRR